MAPPLLVLALELRRTPLRFRHLSDPARALPAVFGDWLAETAALFGTARIRAAAEALGSDPESLQSAFLFLLRQVLLIPQADNYRVLGLSRSCTEEAVKHHHGLLMRLFHPDRTPEADDHTVHLAARINGAYQVLRDPEARRRYDGQLPPLPEMDPAEFFRPRDPVPADPRPRPAPASASGRVGTAVVVLSLGGVLIGAALWLGERPGETRLRINPQFAGGAGSGPSYLQDRPAGGAEPRAQPRPGEAGEPPRPEVSAAASAVGVEVEDGPVPNLVRLAGAQPAVRPGAGTFPTAELEGDTALALALALAGAGEVPPAQPEAVSVAVPLSQPVPVSSAGDRAVATQVAPSGEPGTMSRERAGRPRSQGAGDGQVGSAPVPRAQPAPAPAAAEAQLSRRPDAGGEERPRLAPKVGSPEGATHPGPPQPSPDRGQSDAAAGVLARLEQTFAAGDMAGLVSLFTANAVVNGGRGANAIRRAYGPAQPGAGQRRLALGGLRWSTLADQRLEGRGTIRLSTRAGSKADWMGQSGPFEIELVPWMGDYKISRLIHPFQPH